MERKEHLRREKVCADCGKSFTCMDECRNEFLNPKSCFCSACIIKGQRSDIYEKGKDFHCCPEFLKIFNPSRR